MIRTCSALIKVYNSKNIFAANTNFSSIWLYFQAMLVTYNLCKTAQVSRFAIVTFFFKLFYVDCFSAYKRCTE